ncbi:MAG: DUF1549 domain-containing protein, partial [Pirellulaceae bacterium]|nr:DUF1549 domain-containing protein [Pirellulaceae bacterium]
MLIPRPRVAWLLVAWYCAASASARAATPEPTPEQVKYFEEKVRPILAENCYQCHGTDEQKGSLRLDLRTALLAGGDSGAVVVPGKPAESLLVEAINYGSYEMPPSGKLKPEQIATLTEWVRLGAPMPKDHGSGSGVEVRKTRGIITDEDRQWWAFQPIRREVPPPIRNPQSAIHNSIDAFISARLGDLIPAPEADRATLIRRVTWDLIGLPPTPAEIDSFLADQRPDAYERLVDRLLASPHHGERWGRHWLDIVRYAESDGYKQDAYRPDAWHYRDYVIRSLNHDKPYSQFVLEQLAGDEADPANPDAIIATGYLRLGIYEYNQRDVRTQWTNILNDVTDVTADVFLGMGMSCARCHDHKFDPILQKDYFRLQAFLAPILWRDRVPVASAEEMADYHRRLADWETKTAEIRRQLDEIERPVQRNSSQASLNKFPEDIQAIFAKPEAERSPLEVQLTALAYLQATDGEGKVDFAKKLKGDAKEKWEKLRAELAALESEKPAPLPCAPSVTPVIPSPVPRPAA